MTPTFSALRRAVLPAALAVLSAGLLRAEKLVTVRAVADSAYAARRVKEKPPAIETYVFVKGQFAPGVTRDPSLDKMSFYNMATTVAAELKQQRYEPAKTLGVADLVIVMHWGVTTGNDRGGALLDLQLGGLTDAIAQIDQAKLDVENDISGELSAIGVVEAAEAGLRSQLLTTSTLASANNDIASANNAELLGLSAALNEEDQSAFDSDRGRTLRSMIDEERYFIILMAYDAKSLLKGASKKRLWTSRLSIRSAGVNFRTAVSRMSIAGGAFFGTRQPALVMQPTKDRVGDVKIGEITVVGDKP